MRGAGSFLRRLVSELRSRPRGAPFGRYELIEKIAQGGMGEVWKARLTGPKLFSKYAVLKRMAPHLVTDTEMVQMFGQEAKVCARLDHPNIVRVFEFGVEKGEYFLSMEWVDGVDLWRVIKEHLRHGPLPPGMVASIMRDVCRALAYAHAMTDEMGNPLQLVHRDVSPSNVMVAFDGHAKLLDFGIAKALADVSAPRTRAGVLKGKFAYMAPEQFDQASIDHRCDQFAAGIVLFEALAGRRLFKGTGDLQTIQMVRTAVVPPPSQLNPAVPPELDRVCLRALERDRDRRYPDCGAMAVDLDAIAQTLEWNTKKTVAVLDQLFPGRHTEPTEVEIEGTTDPLGTVRKVARRRTRWPRRRVIAALVLGALVATAVSTVALAGRWLYRRVRRAPAKVIVMVPQVLDGAAKEAPAGAGPERGRAALETSMISVRTTPPGAEIFVVGDRELRARGTSPMTLELPRGGGTVQLELRLEGHQSTRIPVRLDGDRDVQVALAPRQATTDPEAARGGREASVPRQGEGRGGARGGEPRGSDVRGGAVVDPFSKPR